MFHLSHPIAPMDQKMLVGGLEHDLNKFMEESSQVTFIFTNSYFSEG